MLFRVEADQQRPRWTLTYPGAMWLPSARLCNNNQKACHQPLYKIKWQGVTINACRDRGNSWVHLHVESKRGQHVCSYESEKRYFSLPLKARDSDHSFLFRLKNHVFSQVGFKKRNRFFFCEFVKSDSLCWLKPVIVPKEGTYSIDSHGMRKRKGMWKRHLKLKAE